MYRTIDSDKRVIDLLRRWKADRIKIVGMDFEGEFNLHEYGERLCLVQVFDGRQLYIVDPFKVKTSSLRSFLENPDILKVIFDSNSDQALLRKSHGIHLCSILDLKPAVDILGVKSGGLSKMLNRYLGAPIMNKNKFQKHNWTRRPIDEAAIEYALYDVRYLLELKDRLMEQLIDSGKLDEYILANCKTQNSQNQDAGVPRIFQNKKYKSLSRAEKDRFRRVYELRDQHARKLNWPPNNVLANNTLFDIAAGAVRIENLPINSRIPAAARTQIREGLIQLSRQDRRNATSRKTYA